MSAPTGWPDLSRTAAALEEYDALCVQPEVDPGVQERMFKAARRRIEHAFAVDTSDRNEYGVAVQAGFTFIRICVAGWRANALPAQIPPRS